MGQQRRTPFIKWGIKRRKKDEGEKEIPVFEHHLFMPSPAPLHGAFHWTQRHETHVWNVSWEENKSNYWRDSLVGVIESCGSVICVTGISSLSCGFMWIIKESLQKNFASFSPLWIYFLAPRMNLLKGHIMLFIRLLLLLACLVLWFFIKHVCCILYTDGSADLSG